MAWLQAAVAITLPAVRGLLQQRYSSRSDVVTRWDMGQLGRESLDRQIRGGPVDVLTC